MTWSCSCRLKRQRKRRRQQLVTARAGRDGSKAACAVSSGGELAARGSRRCSDTRYGVLGPAAAPMSGVWWMRCGATMACGAIPCDTMSVPRGWCRPVGCLRGCRWRRLRALGGKRRLAEVQADSLVVIGLSVLQQFA